ncbi:MAG: hypothetical protein KF777_24795 [Planctomycetaceae bacterium]|nr:hypothetical protein [Planctomycetaceae bacterium]
MLKLNVGWSRKAGEANFGSRGASVNLELEIEAGLVNQPEELQERIRRLYRLAKASVDEELSSDSQPMNGNGHTNGHRTNGHSHANGHSNGSRRSNGRSATASQVRALHAIASRQRIDLTGELRQRYDVDRLDDLSISEASEMIDALKPQTSENGGRR